MAKSYAGAGEQLWTGKRITLIVFLPPGPGGGGGGGGTESGGAAPIQVNTG